MDIHVFLGQGGHLFSPGFAAFADRLKSEFPDARVKVWGPHDWQQVAYEIAIAQGPFILLSYSLGGNAITWASRNIGKDIDLAVLYDPTMNGPMYPLGKNFKRVLSYHNTLPDLFGKAVATGENVEVTEVSIPHIFIQSSEELHQKTIQAIREVQEKYDGERREQV